MSDWEESALAMVREAGLTEKCLEKVEEVLQFCKAAGIKVVSVEVGSNGGVCVLFYNGNGMTVNFVGETWLVHTDFDDDTGQAEVRRIKVEITPVSMTAIPRFL